MSIQAISYVLQQSPTKLWDRLVLISLANHANDRLETWPAVQTIAHEAGMHERTVQRALRRLERIGEIMPSGDRSVGGRRSTRYVLVGFADMLKGVGELTPGVPLDNVGFSMKNLRNRQDKGQKVANTPAARHPTPGKAATPPPAARHPTPGNIATPGVAHTPPLPAKGVTPPPAARHPWGGKAATLSVIEPSLNQDAKHPAPAARPESGRQDALRGGENPTPPPPQRPPEPPQAPADRANMRELLEHMRAVAAGKAMPDWVGEDYTPEVSDGEKE